MASNSQQNRRPPVCPLCLPKFCDVNDLDFDLDTRRLSHHLPSRETRLMAAAKNGHAHCIKGLIAAGADVNAQDLSGNTALIKAIHEGHLQSVKILLQEGADLNPANALPHTSPLVLAVLRGKFKIVKFLLNSGDNVNKEICGKTVLMYACGVRDNRMVKLLIEAGADVKKVHKNTKETALHIGVWTREIVKTLVKAGADVNAQDSVLKSPLHNAVKCAGQNNANILIQAGADVNCVDINGQTSLHIAAWQVNCEAIKILIKGGADINAVSEDGKCPLCIVLNRSASSYSRDCMNVLLAAGAMQLSSKPMVKLRPHISLLLYAAGMHKFIEAAQESEEYKDQVPCEVNLKHQARNAIRNHLVALDKRTNLFIRIPLLGLPTETALIKAVNKGHLQGVKILLQEGADLNPANALPHTSPLVLAVFRGNSKIVKYLLNSGDNVNKRVYGITVLMHACDVSDNTMVKLLVEAGADVNKSCQDTNETALHLGVKSRRIVKTLVEAGADVNALDYKLRSPLHGAVECSAKNNADILIQAGADVNCVNVDGHTPLHVAARRLNCHAIKTLTEAGADVNALDEDGQCPLYIVLRGSLFDDPTDCLNVLLAAGAHTLQGPSMPRLKLRPHTSLLLYAAGMHNFREAAQESEEYKEQVPCEVNLKHLARNAIRNYLVALDNKTNLFVRIPLLGLPTTIMDYLVFEQTLDIDMDEFGDESNQSDGSVDDDADCNPLSGLDSQNNSN